MSSDPTKPVSCRLPLWVLASCYDLLEKTGVEKSETLGYGAAVRQALESVMQGFIEKGILPSYDNAQLRQKFRVRVREPVIFPVDSIPSAQDVQEGGRPLEHASGSVRVSSGSTTAFDIAQEVARRIDGEEPDIREEVVINENVEPPKPLGAPINLFNTPCLSDAELKRRAPKDRFVQLLDLSTSDEMVKQAIRVIYKSLPLEMWGGEIAEHQINMIMQRHSERA